MKLDASSEHTKAPGRSRGALAHFPLASKRRVRSATRHGEILQMTNLLRTAGQAIDEGRRTSIMSNSQSGGHRPCHSRDIDTPNAN